MIAELQIKVMDLEGEAKLFRGAALISFVLFGERIWNYFFCSRGVNMDAG